MIKRILRSAESTVPSLLKWHQCFKSSQLSKKTTCLYSHYFLLRRVSRRHWRWLGRSSWTVWISTSPPGCQLVRSWRKLLRRGIRYETAHFVRFCLFSLFVCTSSSGPLITLMVIWFTEGVHLLLLFQEDTEVLTSHPRDVISPWSALGPPLDFPGTPHLGDIQEASFNVEE